MKSITRILDTNKYSINIKNDYMNLEKINSYYPTYRNLRLLDKFLDLIEKNKNFAVLLSGAYGTGKSYFSAILLNILGSNYNPEFDYKEFIEKSQKIYDIKTRIELFQEKKYFIVFIDDLMDQFSKGILLGLTQSSRRENIKLNLSTDYEIIENKISIWKKNYKDTLEKFEKSLEKYGNKENFYDLLEERDEKSIEIFSEVYEEIFSGEKFIALEKINRIDVLLKEVEKQILDQGYSGVIYVFDEFGRYLETNINSIDVKEIQDIAEYCNQNNCSSLLMITHKDIFQYGDKIKNRENKDEWEKVSGRFLKEHLIYEKVNVLEILQNIIKRNGYDEFRNRNIKEFLNKEKLLEKLEITNEDSKHSVEKFYPLDYISALILPDFSQKLAQNERTLFAFICGTEDKGLKNILEFSNQKFIGLDRIYDYFEESFKSLPYETQEYKTYINAKNILDHLQHNDEEERIFIKSLALIYIYNKFSEIVPNPEVMKYLLGKEDISEVEKKLKENNFISYRRHYNHYKLVEDIDINVDNEIKEYIEKNLNNFDYMKTLYNFLKKDVYYPLKYNDTNKINRYLGQYFLDVSDLTKLDIIRENIYEDGKIVYLTNIENNENYLEIKEFLTKNDFICIYNKFGNHLNILNDLKELEAIERISIMDIKYSKDGILKKELMSYREEIFKKIEKNIDLYFEEGIIEGDNINSNFNLLEATDEYLINKYNKYIPLNYELINKHNLSSPMKKSRLDILQKLLNKEFLEEAYFMDTKAESSVARVVLEKKNLYKNGKINISDSEYSSILKEILEDIKREKTSFDKIYQKYCSNLGSYGFRKGLFTMLLGVLIVDNWDEISITIAGTKNELEMQLSIIDSIEKNPEKYEMTYYLISDLEMEYMKKLNEIFISYTSEKDEKIYNRILNGVKNYVLSLPRYMTGIYLKEFKNLSKVLRGIFSINNGKEFLLNDIPRAYKSNDYEQIVKELYVDIINFNKSSEIFVRNLEFEVVVNLGFNNISLKEAIKNIKLDHKNNEIKNLLISLENNDVKEILSELSRKIKGFSYENWRSEEDIEDFKASLKNLLEVEEKNEDIKVSTDNFVKIIFNDVEKDIDLGIEETMLGKMLKSKLESTIKNMGITISQQEKIKIVTRILLDI